MPAGTPWTEIELLAAFRLYCHTPFGKLHRHNPEIIQLARLIERTPDAVAMKTCNFASLDPMEQKRNISGLSNVSRADQDLWDRFHEDSEALAVEAEVAYERLLTSTDGLASVDERPKMPEGPTETDRVVKTRRVQSFFRATVLASYGYCCALSGLGIPELLNASHIIPWNRDRKRRADPRNGISLNALYDRAFDRGLMTIDESLRVALSPRLRSSDPPLFHKQAILNVEGQQLKSPERFAPDPEALSYHRTHIFKAS